MPESALFLIDAHALCYRSYFAIRNLSTTKGQATNAVYGFVSTLRKILREKKPAYLAVCFDAGKKTLRQEKFAQYKIHRPAMPDDLISQIPIIKEMIAAYNLPCFELAGFEADDLIATVTQKMQAKMPVVIVSDDKDMLQLVNDRVKVYSVRKDEVLGPREAQEFLGVKPENIADFIGLAGDQTDNIPGVVGIGEVTARSLIQQYGDLENILRHLDEIKPEKVQEKLKEQAKMALLCKELAVLDTHVPLEINVKELGIREPNYVRLYELFRDLEFRKFVEELPVSHNEPPEIKTRHLRGPAALEGLIKRIEKKKEFAFLLDVTPEPMLTGTANLFLAISEQEVFIVELGEARALAAVFADHKVKKITHDVKKALKILPGYGLAFQGSPLMDVMLAAYLLVPSNSSYELETLSWQYLKKSPGKTNPFAQGAAYLLPLASFLEKELKEKALLKLFDEIEIPLAHVLCGMESEGVRLDLDLLTQLSKAAEIKINTLVESVYKAAGKEFNLNSPKQLSQLLFEELKLPVIKKTKTGFSTDEDVLVKLSKAHKIPALILEYRQLAKLKSTYIDALPQLVDEKTGRVHTQFHQIGTETGRLSSSDPNLQNIPIRTELGRQVRKAFIPFADDHVIVSADYSQIELRILAHLSRDRTLRKAFEKEEDIHQYTAALIFEVSEKDVTPQMRNSAKRVNFGIIYGMSAFGLSKDLEISREEAQDFIDKYFLRYPQVKEFMDHEIKKAEDRGFVLTLLNRRRYLPEINSANINIRQFAQRQAINTPVQGSAADLMKLAMINIQREIEKNKLFSRMIITVHDELVFDVPVTEKEKMTGLIRQQMEHAIDLSVPVKAAIKAGKNWLEMKEIK